MSYPAGTKVIITWSRSLERIGQIFETTDYVLRSGNYYSISRKTILPIEEEFQELVPNPLEGGLPFIHPTKWMRPINEDPDKETIPEEQEVEA